MSPWRRDTEDANFARVDSLSLVPEFVQPALAQTTDPEAASPYGGVAVTVGQLSGATPGAAPPSGSICPAGTPPACVLTGQYNRGRQGLNNEPTLAGYGTGVPSKFTNINYYATDPLDYFTGVSTKYNPIMAQRLWLNNVPVSSSTYNLMIAATLNDTIYAFAADGTSAGTAVWKRNASTATSLNMKPLSLNCGTGGLPITPSASGPAGALPYYGVISTPVIDTVTTDPVLFKVSGCISSTSVQSWYLNAVDVTTGADIALSGGTIGGAGGLLISGTGFVSQNQMQRPSILLTHALDSHSVLRTYVYISFGIAVYEIGSGSSSQGYHGFVFGYEILYGTSVPSSVSASALSGSPFNTSKDITTTGVYPHNSSAAIGASPANSGPAKNPSCGITDSVPQLCFHGDNWVDDMYGHGSGVWMAGKGPSSDSAGNVYFASGNGSFDCVTTSTACATVGSLKNFGESAIELSGASVTPADFYAPNVNNVANDQPANNGSTFAAAGHQTQALSRYDLDFGTPGVVLFSTSLGNGNQLWAVTADKTGYVYSMPTLKSGTGSTGMGQFQANDGGLISGTFTTQVPFQLSRLPGLTGSSTVCPAPYISGTLYPTHFTAVDCDQIMGFAYWNNYLFAWPENETIIATKGTGLAGSPTSFTFDTTTPKPLDPCPSPAVFCQNYPQATYPGGNMAIAGNLLDHTKATLWVSFINTATGTGELRAFGINPGSTGSSFLNKIYDPSIQGTNANHCTGLPTLPASWTPSSFAQPTVANGMVFSPVFKAKNSVGAVISGGGVLVFGTCS